jgi:hypothetical protein
MVTDAETSGNLWKGGEKMKLISHNRMRRLYSRKSRKKVRC